MARISQKTRSESGTAILESVIALPLLLLVLFAIFELGLAFIRAQILTNAAREGAREASLFRPGCDAGTVKDQATAVVKTSAARLGMSAGALEVAFDKVCQAGAQVSVNVSFLHELPVLTGLSNLVGAPAGSARITLSARAQMRNENL